MGMGTAMEYKKVSSNNGWMHECLTNVTLLHCMIYSDYTENSQVYTIIISY